MKTNRTPEPLAPVIPIGIKYTEFKCGNCKQVVIVPEPSPLDMLQGNRESGAFNLMHQHVKDCKRD